MTVGSSAKILRVLPKVLAIFLLSSIVFACLMVFLPNQNVSLAAMHYVGDETSLKDAINNAKNGDIIYLTTDIQMKNSARVFNKDITITSLSSASVYSDIGDAFYVDGSATLRLINITTGTISLDNCSLFLNNYAHVKSVLAYENSTLTMNSGSSATNVYVRGGSFVLNGGVISGSGGFGVHIISSTFIMNGGIISDHNNAGVILSSGTFTMNDGIIKNNKGSGVNIGNAIFTMNGGVISENTTDYRGGGVLIDFQGAFTMNGGLINRNTAEQYGGGVALQGAGTFNMLGGSIEENNALRGGAVYVFSNSSAGICTFTIGGGISIPTIRNNISTDGNEYNIYYYSVDFLIIAGNANIYDTIKLPAIYSSDFCNILLATDKLSYVLNLFVDNPRLNAILVKPLLPLADASPYIRFFNVVNDSYYYLGSLDGNIVLTTDDICIVTFLDWDGTFLETQEVKKTGSILNPPITPQRENYRFSHWDKPLQYIEQDTVVTAQYTINKYVVTFLDWDGKSLRSYPVDHGSSAVPPPNPQREGYTFIGWDSSFSNVTQDIIVTAQYKEGAPPKDSPSGDLTFDIDEDIIFLLIVIVGVMLLATLVVGFSFLFIRKQEGQNGQVPYRYTMDASAVKRQLSRLKYARQSLLLIVVLTIVNIVLSLFGIDFYFLFSATLPSFIAGLGYGMAEELQNSAFLLIGLAVASIIIILYLACWFFARKRRLFILLALILFTIDCLVLSLFILFTGFEIAYFKDIVFHIFILFFLVSGTIAWKRLRGISVDDSNISLK